MTCPRCKTAHDVIQYVPLEIIEEFASETTPCYKCPKCKWIFAPADPLPHNTILALQDLIAELRAELRERVVVQTP